MESAARMCAIVTGSVAGLCGLVNLSWWFNTRFAAYSGYAVMFTAFMTGFIGFFVMFGMILSRTGGRQPTVGQAVSAALVWRMPARLLLLVGLGIILASAIAGGVHADAQVGKWGIDTPYGWHNCHWPLTANHDSEHTCVRHERYLAVQHATDRIFVAFGIGLLTIDCLAFTTLSRMPRPTRRAAVRDGRA
jgi:hypothetical protein